jgi:hypothetical protein
VPAGTSSGIAGAPALAPAAPGAAGKLEAVGSVERAAPELPQPRAKVMQTVELMDSSRKRVGMFAQLNQPALDRATGCDAARAERSEAERGIALPGAQTDSLCGQK